MELENFVERMGRILLFAPLYKLQRRKYTRLDGTEVSGMELGLMTLLFFFEQMLDGKKTAGIRELAGFLQDQTYGSLFETFSDYEKLAREIINIFRPSTGRRNEEPFYDWPGRKPGSAQYSYLKADKADMNSNLQYYVLDEQGLELVFATKEYFNEYQLSINQLILRKQLEKGQFALALRQVEEMRLDVETLRSRMHRIRREIHRSIVSEETLSRYRKIVEDLNDRLKSEENQFKDLKTFIGETKTRIHNNINTDPDRRAFDSILDVERHLDVVHGSHRQLLQLGIELGTSALAAAEEALYFSGMDSFNFESEITTRYFSTPLPLTASRRIIEPFLPLAKASLWSPLDVFAPQRLERLDRENTQEEFPDLAGDTEEPELNKENIRIHYEQITADLLTFLNGRARTTLRSFLSYEKQHNEPLCSSRQFYIFWMLLHKRIVLELGDDKLTRESVFSLIAQKHPELRSITVTTGKGILQVPAGRITNMEIEVETSHGI